LAEDTKVTQFDEVVAPHLSAAYNLARWLVGNVHDAEDLVQEACLRAFKSIEGFHGGNSRAWLLTIVRNTCYTWLRQNKVEQLTTPFDEAIHNMEDASRSPEALVLESADADRLREALEALPSEFREVIILRELEGMSYKEIAELTGVPTGTVMSRLARARQRLQHQLIHGVKEER
jgi:RNA polymerase sigma-70 factor (ECF subfamily)